MRTMVPSAEGIIVANGLKISWTRKGYEETQAKRRRKWESWAEDRLDRKRGLLNSLDVLKRDPNSACIGLMLYRNLRH